TLRAEAIGPRGPRGCGENRVFQERSWAARTPSTEAGEIAMAHARVTSIIASVCAVVSIAIALSVLGSGTLEATQAPKMKLDMVPAGNFYSDPGSGGENSMSVGTVQNCLTN